MKDVYKRQGYEKELARDKAKEAMKPGNPAPEFTLKDLDVAEILRLPECLLSKRPEDIWELILPKV